MFELRCLLKHARSGDVFCVYASIQEIDQCLDGSSEWLVGSVLSDSPFSPQLLEDVLRGNGTPVRTPQRKFRTIVNQYRHAVPVISELAAIGIASVATVDRSRSRVMINAESALMFSFNGQAAYDLGDRFALSVYVPICEG